MKKRKTVDELIRIMEDVLREIKDDRTSIFIDVTINPCQNMCSIPQEIIVQKKNKTSVDVIETDKKIHAIVELPGLSMKDIALSCNGWELDITAKNVEKIETFETIELPARVIKSGMKATYQNGILEVIFNKSKKRSKKE